MVMTTGETLVDVLVAKDAAGMRMPYQKVRTYFMETMEPGKSEITQTVKGGSKHR